jgi:hypothetical protein
MRLLLQLLSFIGLALTIVPAVLVFTGHLAFETNQTLMLIGMVLWFGATPFWMGKGKKEAAAAKG